MRPTWDEYYMYLAKKNGGAIIVTKDGKVITA